MHDQGTAAGCGEAFWTDDEYDREHASDGMSRYGHYVRSAARSGLIAECWDGTWDDAEVRRVRFAAAAWETASSPVMSPGYVRRHPRLLSGRVEYCAWDGTLTGVAELVAPWPHPLARSRDWQHGEWWRDWPVEQAYGGGEHFDEWYREPAENEIASDRYLMTTARMVFPLPLSGLPAAPSGPDDDVEDTAREAVMALVAAMNVVVGPVLAALERS
jgi:hypothetical protein